MTETMATEIILYLGGILIGFVIARGIYKQPKPNRSNEADKQIKQNPFGG